MFALEINFKDGVSQPEMVLIRRPQALIGGSDYAHVVVDDLAQLPYQLRLVRDVGRKFRCQYVPTGSARTGQAMPEDKIFSGEGMIDVGSVKLQITSLDSDLTWKDGDTPDRAGIRVMRRACSAREPLFPAVVVSGAEEPMVISFSPDQPVFVGRSKECAVRLESANISSKHARMGYEGGEFWVEDLGSTNGTFVEGRQVSGRVSVPAGVSITLGREITIRGVVAEDQIAMAQSSATREVPAALVQHALFPIVVSTSEIARPARLVLPTDREISVGRDPSSDLWLGAPHISRRHCALRLERDGSVVITDYSTNGTAYDGGILKRGDALSVQGAQRILNFGGGVLLALCFDENQERSFLNAETRDVGIPEDQAGLAREVDRATIGQTSQRPRLGTDRYIPPLSFYRRIYLSGGFRRRIMLILTALILILVASAVLNLILPVLK